MPVLSDPAANLHYEDVGSEWTHVTMNSAEATVLRWRAYLDVAAKNPNAINVDVFRGSNVEKDYGLWSPEFPALKAVELFAAQRVDPAGLDERGVSRDDVVSEVRRHLQSSPDRVLAGSL